MTGNYRVAVRDVRHNITGYSCWGREAYVSIYNDLAVFTADDNVITVTGGNGIVTAVVRFGRPDAVNVIRINVITGIGSTVNCNGCINASDIGRCPVDITAVTKDHVIAIGTMSIKMLIVYVLLIVGYDDIGIDTAKDNVIANAGGYRVRTADERFDSFNQTKRDR